MEAAPERGRRCRKQAVNSPPGGRFGRRLVGNSLLITGDDGTKPGRRHGNLRVCNVNSAEISVFQSNCCSLTVGAGGDEKKMRGSELGMSILDGTKREIPA